MCYWCSASLLAWGALSLIGVYWYPLHATSAAMICIAVAIGCGANWLRNRTLHCGITGPLFLIAGVVFLLSDARVFQINPDIVWSIVAVLTGVSFLLEWRYTSRSQSSSGTTKSRKHQ
jgi:hypothetical protein